MIGTNIRSLRHLWRVCGTNATPLLVKFNEDNYDLCLALKTDKESRFGESLAIFNNYFSHSPFNVSTYLSEGQFNAYKNDISQFTRVWTITNSSLPSENLFIKVREIILLPQTFLSDYQAFIKNNSKMFKSLHEKFSFSTDCDLIKNLYRISNGSKNFFSWAINAYYTDAASFNTIVAILKWNDLYGQLSKGLSKGTITAYNTKTAINELVTEMYVLRKNKRISDAINLFNTAQKKLIKNHELSEKDKETFSKFSKLSETKQINFIKKSSTINDFDELMRLMRHVCSIHFEWNKASFMDYIENVDGVDCKIIFEKENIVLVQVFDYETIKQLAKTTNWCISKNKSYWNNYIENYKDKANQYLIFDFSKKEDDNLSIVGFTTIYNKGITHSHDFVNNSLMDDGDSPSFVLLKSYVSRFLTKNNIYGILKTDGIDINMISDFDKPLYEWNKEAVFKNLYECVDKENVDILMSNGNKIALSVKDSNIRYFFGDAYHDNIPSEYWSWQHIIFFDFSMSEYDSNKVQFAVIANGGLFEDTCQGVFNENSVNNGVKFETKLIEYDLPYDIIRRTDNALEKMKDGILSFNMPLINDCIKSMKKSEIKDVIYDYVDINTFCNLLALSIKHYVSFDYLDMFYKRGIMLNKIIGTKKTIELCRMILLEINTINRRLELNFKVPSKEDVNDFYNEKIHSREYATYIGCYLMINRILDTESFSGKENYNMFSKRIVELIKGWKGEMADVLMKLIDIFFGWDFKIKFKSTINGVNF